MALRLPAPVPHAARPPSDRGGRVQLPRPALRQQPRAGQAQEGDVVRRQHVHPELGGRREGASDHGHPLLLGAGARAGGQDELLGPRRIALRADAVRRRQPRRLRRGLADHLRRRQAVLRQGGRAARLLRNERRPGAGAGRDLPAAEQAQLRGGGLPARHREDGPPLHPRPRGRDHRRRPQQQVPHALPGTRGGAGAGATSTPPSIRPPRSSIPRATPATSPSGPTRSSPRCSSTRPRARRGACA